MAELGLAASWYILAGLPLLARVPDSASHNSWLMHQFVDLLLMLAGAFLLFEYGMHPERWVGSPEEATKGAYSAWFVVPPCLLISTSILSLIGIDWLLFRRAVGLELIGVGLAILALTAARLQESPQRFLTFWFPAIGLSYLVVGLAVVAIPGPLPPPLAGRPISLHIGLVYLLCGLATFAAPAAGRFSNKPFVRGFVGLALVAGGAARLFAQADLVWVSILGHVAAFTSVWVAWREIQTDRRLRSR